MSERNTRCPVLGCGRWSNRCSGRHSTLRTRDCGRQHQWTSRAEGRSQEGEGEA